MLGGAHLRALPVKPLQVDEQVGAVAFDRGHHVVRAALLDQAPGGLFLDMHRVDGHDPALEVQPDGQAANGRDLVALVRDRFLPEHVPGQMLHGRHEVVLAVGVFAGGGADPFAVDGDGLSARLCGAAQVRAARSRTSGSSATRTLKNAVAVGAVKRPRQLL